MNIQQIIRHHVSDQGKGRSFEPGTDGDSFTKFVTISGFLLCIFYLLGMVLAISTPVLAETWQVEKAFKEVKLQGYTRSIKTAVLSAEVTGKLLHLNYDVGDVIGKK